MKKIVICIVLILVFMIIYAVMRDESFHKELTERSTMSSSPQLVSKMYEGMSVNRIVECLVSVEIDSDLILLSRYINPENASSLCDKFYKNIDDSIRMLLNRDKKWTIARYIVSMDNVTINAKNQFVVKLASSLQNDPYQLEIQVAEYLWFLHHRSPYTIREAVSPEELLQQIPPEVLYDIMVRFEKLSYKHDLRNFNYLESERSPRSNHRPGTHWALTLMQSIVNFQHYTPDQKRASFRVILSKAREEAPKRNSEQDIQRYVELANLAIDKLKFDDECDVNALNIFVYNLLGYHGLFDGDKHQAREYILDRFKEENHLN